MKKRNYLVLSIVVLLIVFAVPIKAYADCVVPPSGLVSWWGGDNNALDIIGANNGAIHGGITYGQGEVGRAFNFDGASGSYLHIPPSAALNIQGSLSISAWVYIRNVSGIRLIAGKAGSTQLYSADGILHFVVYSGGAPYHVVSTIALAGNSWHLVAGVFDGNAGVSRIYIDGVLNNTATSIPGQPDTNIAPYEIGGFSAFADNLDGLIDEVAIFNQALTGTDVQNIYNAGSAGMCRPSVASPPGLVSWWRGQNDATDAKGVNHGTLINGATFADGKVGRAFSFDGVNDFVQVLNPQNIPIGNTTRTIIAWIRSTGDTGNYQGIVGYGLPNAGLGSGNSLFFEWGGDAAADKLFQMNLISGGAGFSTLEHGRWYHVALTHDGSATRLYVDAVLESNVNMVQNTVLGPGTDLRIGNSPLYDPYHTYFFGLIDEPAIFNRALTVDEIASIYNAGSSGITPIDITPDAFTFIAQTGMPLNTIIVSNPITVTGISYPTSLSISGGEYSVSTDSGSTWGGWTSTAGTVSVNNQVSVRQTSSASYSTLTTATLTIGGVNGAFNVTTAAASDPNASGLISWWRAENNAFDSIGGHHGAWNGTPSYVSGIAGAAFSLNGVDGEVTVAQFDIGSDWTITAWANPHSCSDNTHCPVLSRSAGNTDGLLLAYLGPSHSWANQFVLVIGDGNGSYWQVPLHSESSYSVDQWHHVVASKSGDTYSLYVDGLLKAQQIATGVSTGYQSRNLEIGHWAYGPYTSGLIDEVKIFNRALSAAEVAALADIVPDAFSFTAQTGVALSTPVESNPITVTGISYPSAISITGGAYSVSTNGGSTWSSYSASTPSTVSLNDQVKVRQTSSSSYSTTTTVTLTIGGVSGAFNVTTLASRTLTITKAGTGSGTVTSSPSGIDCGSTCNAPFGQGTSVDISSSADLGSSFIGFTVDCISNTSPCTVIMSEARNVTATFNNKAEFSGTPLTGSVPHNVIFADASTHSPTAWSWTFGDSGTSTLRNPVHTYRTNGTYTVILTATGTGGASTMTKTGYIQVGPDPCSNPPYKIGGTRYSYPNIQAAYESMGSDTLQIQALEFTGGLVLDQNKTVTLQGGYGCDFTSNPGDTIVSDKLTVNDGKVTIDNLIIE